MSDRTRGNMMVGALSLALAVLVWIFVTWDRPAEIRVSLPVRTVNLPEGLMTEGDSVSQVEVVLSGPRLVVDRLRNSLTPVVLDLRGTGTGTVAFTHLERLVTLPDQVRVLRISPASIDVNLVKRPELPGR